MSRLKPADRKQKILDAAVAEAKTVGFQNVTREAIAKRAECTPALVSHYLGTMTNLRRDVMRAAIRDRVLPVVAQGLAARDRYAVKAPDELKQAALATLMGGGGTDALPFAFFKR